MKTEKINVNQNNLIIGKHYMVKFRGGKFVRRFFKGTEGRFKGEILCYVFSSKVDKRVRVEYNQKEKLFYMNCPGNVSLPAKEVSIPFYDLEGIKECD